MTLEQLNAATFVLGVIMFVLIFARQGDRLRRYVSLRGWRAVPVMLVRDILLFGAFVWIFGGALLSRVFGFAIRDNALWVVTTDIFGLLALAFCLYVEWFVVEDPTDKTSPPSVNKKL